MTPKSANGRRARARHAAGLCERCRAPVPSGAYRCPGCARSHCGRQKLYLARHPERRGR